MVYPSMAHEVVDRSRVPELEYARSEPTLQDFLLRFHSDIFGAEVVGNHGISTSAGCQKWRVFEKCCHTVPIPDQVLDIQEKVGGPAAMDLWGDIDGFAAVDIGIDLVA